MKIKESELRKLIQESLQELALEEMEEEMNEAMPDIEQDILQGPNMNRSKLGSGRASGARPDISAVNPANRKANVRGSDTQKALAGLKLGAEGEKDWDVVEENIEEWGLSGGIGFGGPRKASGMSTAAATGGGRLARQFQQLVMKAKQGDDMALKNAMSIAKANPQDQAIQAGAKELAAMMKKKQATADYEAQRKANPFTPFKFQSELQEASLRKFISGCIKEVMLEAKKKNKVAKDKDGKPIKVPPKGSPERKNLALAQDREEEAEAAKNKKK